MCQYAVALPNLGSVSVTHTYSQKPYIFIPYAHMKAARQALLLKFSPLQSQSDHGSSCSSKNGKNKKSKKASSKKASQRITKKKIPQVANDLSDKLYQTMEKHKEVSLPCLLHSFVYVMIELGSNAYLRFM